VRVLTGSPVTKRGERNAQSQFEDAAKHWVTWRTAPGKDSELTTHGVPFQVTA